MTRGSLCALTACGPSELLDAYARTTMIAYPIKLNFGATSSAVPCPTFMLTSPLSTPLQTLHGSPSHMYITASLYILPSHV